MQNPEFPFSLKDVYFYLNHALEYHHTQFSKPFNLKASRWCVHLFSKTSSSWMVLSLIVTVVYKHSVLITSNFQMFAHRVVDRKHFANIRSQNRIFSFAVLVDVEEMKQGMFGAVDVAHQVLACRRNLPDVDLLVVLRLQGLVEFEVVKRPSLLRGNIVVVVVVVVVDIIVGVRQFKVTIEFTIEFFETRSLTILAVPVSFNLPVINPSITFTPAVSTPSSANLPMSAQDLLSVGVVDLRQGVDVVEDESEIVGDEELGQHLLQIV